MTLHPQPFPRQTSGSLSPSSSAAGRGLWPWWRAAGQVSRAVERTCRPEQGVSFGTGTEALVSVWGETGTEHVPHARHLSDIQLPFRKAPRDPEGRVPESGRAGSEQRRMPSLGRAVIAARRTRRSASSKPAAAAPRRLPALPAHRLPTVRARAHPARTPPPVDQGGQVGSRESQPAAALGNHCLSIWPAACAGRLCFLHSPRLLCVNL